MKLQANVTVMLITPRACYHRVELVSDGLKDPLVLNRSGQVPLVDWARSCPVGKGRLQSSQVISKPFLRGAESLETTYPIIYLGRVLSSGGQPEG